MKCFRISLIFLSAALLSQLNGVQGSETLTFQSTDAQVQVLELFTSQGCSSCPPAERWISQLVDHPGLWSEIVPVVYHVDYWDRLGWKDPFAQKSFTQKQYAYAEANRIRQVYTPCFVSNGREWRGYFSRESLPKESGATGILQAEINQDRLTVHYSEKQPFTLHVSILGCDLETDVKGGENRGKLLKQQFVAVHQSKHSSNSGRWALHLPEYEIQENVRYAIALFITRKGKLEPLQATGTWLTP